MRTEHETEGGEGKE